MSTLCRLVDAGECESGGIGRRARFRIWWDNSRGGSSPPSRTSFGIPSSTADLSPKAGEAQPRIGPAGKDPNRHREWSRRLLKGTSDTAFHRDSSPKGAFCPVETAGLGNLTRSAAGCRTRKPKQFPPNVVNGDRTGRTREDVHRSGATARTVLGHAAAMSRPATDGERNIKRSKKIDHTTHFAEEPSQAWRVEWDRRGWFSTATGCGQNGVVPSGVCHRETGSECATAVASKAAAEPQTDR